MTEVYHVLDSISSYIVTLDILSGSIIWNTLLSLFIVGGILAAIVLFMYSKKPEDWKHESNIEKNIPGRLKYLAESIKINPVDESESAPIKKIIQTSSENHYNKNK